MVKDLLDKLNEELPEQLKNFYFSLGGTPFLLFFLQILTGILLLFHYIPSSEKAYSSVYKITYSVSLGWWIRGLHKYGASVFILTVIIHCMRTFFTGSFNKPRELTWVAGTFILLLALGMGFTGYALVADQLSYWATKVGTEIAEKIPLVGATISNFIKGGAEIGENTIPRIFILHTFVIPLIMGGAIAIHIFLVRLYGVSLKSEKKYPLIPDHLYLEVIILIIIFTFISTLTVIFPPSLGEKANPLITPSHIKPEWYFYPIYLLLKIIPLYPAFSIITLFILAVISLPWWHTFLKKRFKSTEIIVKIAGILVILYYCVGMIIIATG